MNPEVWIVGQVTEAEQTARDTEAGTNPVRWEFQGAFSSLERAISACKSSHYFIGPAILDEEIPDDLSPWPGTLWLDGIPLAAHGADCTCYKCTGDDGPIAIDSAPS